MKSPTRQWAEALVFAIVVVLIVRTLFFDLFKIPTPSMEKNLLVGDYLFVSKLHYGTRLPMTVGIPFTPIYLPGVEFEATRLPGFSTVQRGDAVVFNYPPEDGPIDRKVHYIKRVIGMPGESVSVREKVVHIGDKPLPLGEGMQQYWTVTKSDARYRMSRTRMSELGITQVGRSNDPSIVQILATPAAIKEVNTWSWVKDIEPLVSRRARARLYPADRGYTRDNYGPIHVPAKGETVTLTDENWGVYRDPIVRYEGRAARQMTDSTFAIDGEQTTTYTFEQDYYFVMGDNRDDSQDSRFWGFVPMDHIVGKAVVTYFSWDKASFRPRFGRILRSIDDASVFRDTPVLEQIDPNTSRTDAEPTSSPSAPESTAVQPTAAGAGR